MYSRILFPSDFGEHARQVLECTLEFRHVGLKEIVFLHVIDLDELGWYASPNYLKMREEQIRELAALQFQELEALVREHSVEASSIVETGIPSVEIASAAKSKRASLIIGGSHRKRGDQEEMLDTTTARVVRHMHRCRCWSHGSISPGATRKSVPGTAGNSSQSCSCRWTGRIAR